MSSNGAFEARYDAFRDGLQREDNPHDLEKEPKNHKSWLDGWRKARELRRGSYLNIPAHAKHRVAWTDPAHKTVWLAIHYRR